MEYVGVEGGESGEGGDEEPSINPEDPGGGVNDEHSANSCYDNTPCHIQVIVKRSYYIISLCLYVIQRTS